MSVVFEPFSPTANELTTYFSVATRDGGTLALLARYYESLPRDSEDFYTGLQIYALSYTRYRDNDPDALDVFISLPYPGEFFASIELSGNRVTSLGDLRVFLTTEPLVHTCPRKCADYDYITSSEEVFHDAFFGKDCN